MGYSFSWRETRRVCRGTIALENSEKLDFSFEKEQRQQEKQLQKQKNLQEKKQFLEECVAVFQEDSEIARVTHGVIVKWASEKSCVHNIPQMTMQLTNIIAKETQVEWEVWRRFMERVYEKISCSFKAYLFEDVFDVQRKQRNQE